jgi:hypothetical protein
MDNSQKLLAANYMLKKAEDSSFLGRFFTPDLISTSNKTSIPGFIGEHLNRLLPLGLGKATYYGTNPLSEGDYRKQLDFFKDKGYAASALSTAKPTTQLGGGLGLLLGLAKGGLRGGLAGTLGGAAIGGVGGSLPGLYGKLVDSMVTDEDKNRVAKTLAKNPFLTGTSTGFTDLLTAANS